MARVVVLTGGNIGDIKTRLQVAQQLLNEKVGAVLRCSHRYKSEPWGFKANGGDLFSNQILEISTDLTPEEILDAVQDIENTLGRDRAAEQAYCATSGECYASRHIDVDIIFYDDQVISTDRLTIPHPHIGKREFVLIPLCELMKTRKHPVTGETMQEMLDSLRADKG